MAIRYVTGNLSDLTIGTIRDLLDGFYIGDDHSGASFDMHLSLGSKNSSSNYLYLVMHDRGSNKIIGKFKSSEDAINQLTNPNSKLSKEGYWDPSFLDKESFSEFKVILKEHIGNLSSIGSASKILMDFMRYHVDFYGLGVDDFDYMLDDGVVARSIERMLKQRNKYFQKYSKYGRDLFLNYDYVKDTIKQIVNEDEIKNS